MKVVRTYTFGCKVNKADTVAIEAQLRKAPEIQVNAETEPDVVIVNTCAVTASADRQARQLLRKLHREHPNAEILVTGCSSEADPERYRSMVGVREVVPMANQFQIPQKMGLPIAGKAPEIIEKFGEQTRAYLKMQDGCNAYCAFCILPYIRGRSRSIPVSELIPQMQAYAETGYQEVVVTGVHLGAYGRDLTPKKKLSEALRELMNAFPQMALRVSSVEPTTLSPDLIRLVRERANIQPHFHVPMQSGSDEVLRRMNRKHRVKNFRDRVMALGQARSDMSIGSDVIAGFPGETEQDFQQTVKLIEDLPITYLHVFRYSPRPGTRAANFKDDVPSEVKRERVNILQALGKKKRMAFESRFLGMEQGVLVEKRRDAKGRLCGYTPQYIPVRMEGPDRLMERLVDVRLLKHEGDVVEGVVA